MTYHRLLTPFIAFACFLVTGLWAGTQIGSMISRSVLARAESHAAVALESRSNPLRGSFAPLPLEPGPPLPESELFQRSAPQRTVLVIGVDHIRAARPRLESIWLILYLPDFPHITLMPVYPTVIPDGQSLNIVADANLSAAFQLNSEHRPSRQFLDLLASHDLNWNSFVLLDKTALVDLIDALGGLEVTPENRAAHGLKADGRQYVMSLTSSMEDPEKGLMSQAQLAQGLCRTSSIVELSAGKVIKIYEKLHGHLVTDLDAEQISLDLKSLLLAGGGLSCEFPSLALAAAQR